jgi:catalase
MFSMSKFQLLIRYSAIGITVAVIAAIFFVVSSGLGQSSVTAQAFVDLQEGGSVNPGFRRAHAKGICVSGSFVSRAELSSFSTATVFANGTHPFVGRFSTAGNNPQAPDLAAPVRSLSLRIGDSGNYWHTAMNTPPVMAVRSPTDFYQLITLLKPDPATGKPNTDALMAFFESHPETAEFGQWQASYQPSASFADEQYNSINAFYLVDDKAQKRAVRWSALPVTPSAVSLSSDDPNALQNALIAQVSEGPIIFDLHVRFAEAEDDENDPTRSWPVSRQRTVAGSIVIDRVGDQALEDCNVINFDPLVLPIGITATNDPILNARSAAYAESYRRRAREHLLGFFSEALK